MVPKRPLCSALGSVPCQVPSQKPSPVPGQLPGHLQEPKGIFVQLKQHPLSADFND